MSKPHFRLAMLVAAMGLTAPMAACSKEEAPAAAEQQVAKAPRATYEKSKTTSAEAVVVPEMTVVTGQIAAKDRGAIIADLSARITEVMVDRGQRVKEGDPLVRLDTRSVETSLREARANLSSSRASAKLANDTCARSKDLLAKGAITQVEYDRDLANCTQAREAVNAASARLARTQDTLKDGLVRAPYAGVISARHVAVGEWASPQGKLFNLIDDSQLRADLSFSELQLKYAKEGDKVKIVPIADEEKSYVGEITLMGVEVDAQTRSVKVEVTLPENANELLRPGMFVKAHIPMRPIEAVAVPQSSLIKRGSTWRVYVAAGDKLEERVVQLGPEGSDGRASIVRGVTAGELVATDAAGATDGAELR